MLVSGTGYFAATRSWRRCAGAARSRQDRKQPERENAEPWHPFPDLGPQFAVAATLTNQLMPKLSVHMPKMSPQGAFSSGIVTEPPSASFSK